MTEKKKKVERMEIEKHENGFSIRKHHEQRDRGVYTEPETTIALHHGEVLHHVHEMTKSHGSEEPGESEHGCPYCETGEHSGEEAEHEMKGKKEGRGQEAED